MRVRVVCTRVCAPACAGGSVCTLACVPGYSRVTPWRSRSKFVRVSGMWRETRGLCVCVHSNVHMCTEMRARVGDVYSAARVEDAVRTGGFAHLYMHVGEQTGSVPCTECVRRSDMHERVRVCALLCARERVHAPLLSRDVAVSARALPAWESGRRTAHTRPCGTVHACARAPAWLSSEEHE